MQNIIAGILTAGTLTFGYLTNDIDISKHVEKTLPFAQTAEEAQGEDNSSQNNKYTSSAQSNDSDRTNQNNTQIAQNDDPDQSIDDVVKKDSKPTFPSQEKIERQYDLATGYLSSKINSINTQINKIREYKGEIRDSRGEYLEEGLDEFAEAFSEGAKYEKDHKPRDFEDIGDPAGKLARNTYALIETNNKLNSWNDAITRLKEERRDTKQDIKSLKRGYIEFRNGEEDNEFIGDLHQTIAEMKNRGGDFNFREYNKGNSLFDHGSRDEDRGIIYRGSDRR